MSNDDRRIYEFTLSDRYNTPRVDLIHEVDLILIEEAALQGWAPGYKVSIPYTSNDGTYNCIVYGKFINNTLDMKKILFSLPNLEDIRYYTKNAFNDNAVKNGDGSLFIVECHINGILFFLEKNGYEIVKKEAIDD